MSAPLSPYDPQPANPAPLAPPEPTYTPLEIPSSPGSEPIGVPAIDPGGPPDPGGPEMPSDVPTA